MPLNVGFVLTASDVSQNLVGYDLYLEITGGSGLSITGVVAGSDLLGGDPSYLVTTDPSGDTLYYFNDAILSGTATITNGSQLLQVAARLQAGATGTYQIEAYANPSGPVSTAFYSGIDNSRNPIAITGIGFQNGTVSIAPPGDANLDGRVDINDLTIVLANYSQPGMTWSQGCMDGNQTGTVDINDLTIVLDSYNTTYGASSGVKAVPEPTCLALLGLGAACLLAFARRKWRA